MIEDLNDLRYFAVVVEHNGFSAAARMLGIPKSRISRRVATLEDRLGARLLERSTRQLSLTEVGQRVYEHARAVLIEAEAAEEAVLRMQAEPRGLVRLSCPTGLQRTIEGPLPAFLAAHPLLRVQCIMANRRIALIDEGVDVAIRVRERLDTDPNMQLRRVGTSRRIMVASPDYLDGCSILEGPADLVGLPLLDQAEQQGPGSWHLTHTDGQAHLVTVEPRFASGSFEMLLATARASLGIALLPSANCQGDIASGALVRVLPDWSGSDGIIHIVFTSRRGMLPGVRAVIEFAAEALKAAVAA